MTLCTGCNREVKHLDHAAWAKKRHERDGRLFHRGCLRRKMRHILAEARKQAQARVSLLLDDWRLVLGQWMDLRGYPYQEFLVCPVCDYFLKGDDLMPALQHGIWEIKGIAITAYYCPVCDYFLPCLPDEGTSENGSFDEQWEAIKSVYHGEEE